MMVCSVRNLDVTLDPYIMGMFGMVQPNLRDSHVFNRL